MVVVVLGGANEAVVEVIRIRAAMRLVLIGWLAEV